MRAGAMDTTTTDRHTPSFAPRTRGRDVLCDNGYSLVWICPMRGWARTRTCAWGKDTKDTKDATTPTELSHFIFGIFGILGALGIEIIFGIFGLYVRQ